MVFVECSDVLSIKSLQIMVQQFFIRGETINCPTMSPLNGLVNSDCE